MPSVNGLPSVTEILAAVGLTRSYEGIPNLELYRRRGQALHAAIHYDALGTLDEASVHPTVRPGLDAYRAFVRDTRHRPAHSELELVHPHGFCGHLDRVSEDDVLIDWKYSDSPDLAGAKYQLAGYRLLWEHRQREAARRVVDTTSVPLVQACLVVALRKDGTYRVHDVTDVHAMQIFTAALMVYTARKGNGR